MNRARHGVSLLEVALTVAILSILIALLLPAIQSARESARQSSCLNNLHQLGVFLHSGAGRLDHLDARAIRETVDPYIQMRQCPSDPIGASSVKLDPPIGYFHAAPADYRRTINLLVSPTEDGDRRVLRGAWSATSIKLSRVTDGLSHTMMYVEVAGLPIVYEARPERHPLGAWPRHQPSDREVDRRSWGRFRHHELPDEEATFYSGMQVNCTNVAGVFSFHDHVTLLMCDGSVRMKSAATGPEVMVSHFTRAGGVGDFLPAR